MTRHTLLLLIAVVLVGTAGAQDHSEGYVLSPDMRVRPLAQGVWLHTWWTALPEFGRFSSNGLVIVDDGEALLVDTPIDDAMTELLLRWAADSLGVPIRRAILTHAHSDRMGGIGALQRAGVVSYATALTADWAEAQQKPRPDSLLALDDHLRVGTRTVHTFFPGAGHSPDNIVVWLADAKLLHGGCFLKSEASRGLGNLGDADVMAWPVSVRQAMARYRDAEVVVPGHGPVGGYRTLERTLELLEAHHSQ